MITKNYHAFIVAREERGGVTQYFETAPAALNPGTNGLLPFGVSFPDMYVGDAFASLRIVHEGYRRRHAHLLEAVHDLVAEVARHNPAGHPARSRKPYVTYEKMGDGRK